MKEYPLCTRIAVSLLLATLWGPALAASPTPMTPLWTYQTGNPFVVIPGTPAADIAGNIYWSELDSSTGGGHSFLVSATSTGQIRYRSVIPGSVSTTSRNRDPSLFGSTVILVVPPVVLSDGDMIEAWNAASGTLLWTHAVRDDFPGQGCAVVFSSRPAAANGYLVISASCVPFSGVGTVGALIGIDPATGNTIGHFPTNEALSVRDPLVDQDGNVYASVLTDLNGSQAFVSLAPDGALRYSVPEVSTVPPQQQGTTPVGVLGSFAFLTRENSDSYQWLTIRHTADGSVALNVQNPFGAFVLSGNTVRFFGSMLFDYDLLAQRILWSVPASPGSASLILTSLDTVLFVESVNDPNVPNLIHSTLREIDSAGNEVFRGQLADSTSFPQYGTQTLRNGIWTVTTTSSSGTGIQAFSLPGRDQAAIGWTSTFGSMSRGNRPR